jgi:SH3-like domain-containing protein
VNYITEIFRKHLPGAAVLGALFLLLLSGCKHQAQPAGEVEYVTVPLASLRDRVAAVYNKTGVVNNGEKVDVLEHSRNGRFVRVRSLRGEEGWLEQRYLATQDVYNAFLKLAHDYAGTPVQAVASAKAELNMHLEPSRESDHLFQLKEGVKLELLARATAPKVPKSNAPGASTDAASAADAPPPAYEDWWLVRDPQHHYGWVLNRLLDVDVPLEVAQYAEGQRIVADFILNTVDDLGKKVPQYLLLLNEPKDGLPQDFNQARVFTWNARKQHYETAFREHIAFGVLPAQAGTQEFGREGRLPVFTLRVRDKEGKIAEQKYKMNGVMVRRVTAAGEEAPRRKSAAHSAKRNSQ